MNQGDNMDGAISRHFGAGARGRRTEMLANLRVIRAELDEESTHVVRCRIALNARNSIGYDLLSRVDSRLFCQSNVNATGSVNGNVATLCVDIDGRPAGGWETLLHEMVHLCGLGNLPDRDDADQAQLGSGEYEMYGHEATYPNPMPFSLRNADSYSSFVREVGDSGWSAESNPAAGLPTVEAGPAMTLENNPRPGLSAGLLWTPLGSNLQWILGARALWFPQRDREPALEPTDLRAYAGAELGLRWIVGGDRTQFVLDIAGGGGPYVTVDEQVDPAFAARVGLGLRVGGPELGFGVSADVMRLFHLRGENLVGGAAEDWFGGLMLRGHWGGTSTRPR
jgi:hypothetical protein